MNSLESIGLFIDPKGFIKSHINGNSGHTFTSSMEELIHNSIDAQASQVYILKNDVGIPIIVDNGNGMDDDEMENLTIIHRHKDTINNTIGKYGVGLKDALFCLGKKWWIFSKKKNTEDLGYAYFNIDMALEYINGNHITEKIIFYGIAKKTHEKFYKHILSKLNLLIDDSEEVYSRFSGTILVQEQDITNLDKTTNDDNIDIISNNYQLLKEQIQIRLLNKDVELFYGNYNTIENHQIVVKNLLKINKFDWFMWSKRISGNYTTYKILPYLTKNNHYRFVIFYNEQYYHYNKKTSNFVALWKKNYNYLGEILVQYNILSQDLHIDQILFYKKTNYNSRLNGIIISRNGLDLYTTPNEWYINNSRHNNILYSRCYISFLGNEHLDNLFGIKTNKSLFRQNMVNGVLTNCIDIINNEIYDYLAQSEKNNNNLHLPFCFSKVILNCNIKSIIRKEMEIKTKFEYIYHLINNPFNRIEYILNISRKLYLIQYIQKKYRMKQLLTSKYFHKLGLLLVLSKYLNQLEKGIMSSIFNRIYVKYRLENIQQKIHLQTIIETLHNNYLKSLIEIELHHKYMNLINRLHIHNPINLLKCVYYYNRLI